MFILLIFEFFIVVWISLGIFILRALLFYEIDRWTAGAWYILEDKKLIQ